MWAFGGDRLTLLAYNFAKGKYTVTMIPGDGQRILLVFTIKAEAPHTGIGPEISESIKDIYTAADVREMTSTEAHSLPIFDR
jgi:hypothetical protein